jgi:hypothetical protein
MITDLSAKKCWSWEPNTDKEATGYLQFRTLFEQSDETIKEFKNKKLLTYYILNNLLVRFFGGYSMNNLFAPCKRYTVENIEIGKMLSTNDKFVRPLVLPYIILNFIKNLVDLDYEPQSCSDISGILSKTLSTRKEKHNFSLFGVDAIKMYNHFRLENKCFTDTSNIKFYPNDETTNDVKSSSNKKILHLEKNVKQFFKSGLCFNDSIVSTSFDSYYYHKPQLSANTGSHSTDSSKPFIHYNSVSNNFVQEISPSVITDQSVPCIDVTVSSHIDAPVSSLDATAQPILVPAAEASFVGIFNIEETQQMLEEYFEDQLEIYKANNKLADGKVTYLLKELCNYETSKFIDILRCFFNGVMAKEKYGLSFEREILKMSDEGKDLLKIIEIGF